MLPRMLTASASAVFPVKFLVDLTTSPGHALFPAAVSVAIASMAYQGGMKHFDSFSDENKLCVKAAAISASTLLAWCAIPESVNAYASLTFCLAACIASERYFAAKPEKLRQLTGLTYGAVGSTLSYHLLTFASETFFAGPSGPRAGHNSKPHIYNTARRPHY